ncbi:MAG: hypothetical protein NT018_06140 [Armatimonadetes bacterium]|nr:hypothetical protein [Armatimonadota bacterium]
MRKAIAAIFASVFLFASVSAVWSEPLIYKHKFTKGALGKYRVKTVLNMQMPGSRDNKPMTMSMTLTLMQRTTEVSQDGMGLIKSTITDMKYGNMPAGNNYKPKNASITMFVAKDGRRSNIQGLDANTENPFESAYTVGEQIMFPAKPISVGDTWDSVVQIPGYGADMHIASTLLSDSETIWGQKASKIKQVYSANVDLEKLVKQMAADRGQPVGSFNITGTMDLSGTTVCLFSQSKGLLLTATSQQKAIIKMSMSMGANGSSTPMEFNQEATITSTRFK